MSFRVPIVLQCFLAGLITPLAFAPVGWWLVQILTLGFLFYWLREASGRQAFWRGWVYGLGLFLSGISWIFVSTYYFGNAPLLLAVLLVLMLSAYMALYPAIMAAILCRWIPERMWLIGAPILWLLAEMARGYVLTGFPWLSSGYSQIDGPLSGFAPVFGVYGVGCLVALAAIALAQLRKQPVTVVATMALIFGVGAVGKGAVWTESTEKNASVALIQGNITQDLKWRKDWLLPTLERYEGLTKEAFGADVIIWPEVAIPSTYANVEEDFLNPLAQAAREQGSTLVTGVLTPHAGGGHYNSVVAMTEQPQFYLKQHLVPLGEYFPVPDFVRDLLFKLNMPSTDAIFGPPDQPLFVLDGLNYRVSICFEDVFGEELNDSAVPADIQLNVTNDAWFGHSLAPHQHLEIARMRALESGRYLLRAANTGISAIIAPQGEIVARSAQFSTAILRGNVTVMSGETPYAQWGNRPLWGIAIALLLICLTLRKRFA